jgi:hypothetical protein
MFPFIRVRWRGFVRGARTFGLERAWRSRSASRISYAAAQPTPMVIMLSIHPSRFSDIVGTETIIAEPDVPIGFYRDSFGNVCGRLVAPAGGVTLHGSALVRDSGLPDVVNPSAQQVPIEQLPDELLLYLMPSR